MGLVEAGLLRLGSLYLQAALGQAQLGVALFALACGGLYADARRTQTATGAALAAPLVFAALAALVAAWGLPCSDVAWACGLGAWPFAAFGFCSARALATVAGRARRRLFAAELAGAALGLGVLPTLLVAAVGGAGLLAAGATALATAAALAPRAADGVRSGVVVAAALGVVVGIGSLPRVAAELPSTIGVERHLDRDVARLGVRARHRDESVYARTDLVVPARGADAVRLYTDGMHLARAPRWDGASDRFADDALERLAATRRLAARSCRGGDALVLGAGGGFDVAIALQEGAARVDAVEVNAAMPALLRREAPAYAAVLGDRRVHWHVDEGRRFVEARRRALGDAAPRYRCALLSLVETAPAAWGQLHVDGRLLTRQAFASLRGLLAADGIVIVLHNEAQLAEASRAALSVAFGSAAVRLWTRPNGPASKAEVDAARYVVAASAGAAPLAALAAAAHAQGLAQVGSPAALRDADSAPDDARPLLRPPGGGVGAFATAVAAGGLAVAVLVAALRRRRRAEGTSGPAVGTLAAALASGFAGAALQVAIAARAAAWIGSPVLALQLSVTAALIGGGVMNLVAPSALTGAMLALVVAIFAGGLAGALDAALAGAPLTFGVVATGMLALAGGAASAGLFGRALGAAAARPAQLAALDGAGALLGAAAIASLLVSAGPAALGLVAGLVCALGWVIVGREARGGSGSTVEHSGPGL